jgi:hypothetical protein
MMTPADIAPGERPPSVLLHVIYCADAWLARHPSVWWSAVACAAISITSAIAAWTVL